MVSGEIYYECTETVRDGVNGGITDCANACIGLHGGCNGKEARERGPDGGIGPCDISLSIPDVNDVFVCVL